MPEVGSRPAIRAIQTQNLLRLSRDLPAEQLAAFEQRVDGSTVESALSARPMSWVAMGEHMHLCEALWALVGRDPFVDLFRATFVRSMSNPMLQGIFGLIRKVSPNSVAMLLRNASRIYGHVTRDVGQLRYSPGEDRGGVLTMSGWPSAQFDFDCWLDGTRGAVLGALEGVGARASAEVAIEDRDEAAGLATYRVRW